MSGIQVFDNVLADPEAYRAEALKLPFRSYDFGHVVFHGIAVGEPSRGLLEWIKQRYPEFQHSVTFFRRSPLGQVEPHLIHTDVDMGEWSFILYLNPTPPPEDGTCFWTHTSGAIESAVPHERSKEGESAEGWTMREHVRAAFNRLLIFPSTYFHSRAIFENHGEGDEARLTQVAFGRGLT